MNKIEVRKYYYHRDELLRYIKNNCEFLHSNNNNAIDDFLPIEDDGLFSAPVIDYQKSKYLRTCYYANESIENILIDKINHLKKMYFELFGSTNKLPLYFPKVFENVNKVVLSISEAYSSRNFTFENENNPKKNKNIGFRYNRDIYEKLPKEIIEFLDNNKIRYLNKRSEIIKEENELFLNLFDLMRFFNTKKLTYRVFTGNQYIASLSKNNEKALKYTYGFMIFTKSRPVVKTAIKKCSYSHKLIKTNPNHFDEISLENGKVSFTNKTSNYFASLCGATIFV